MYYMSLHDEDLQKALAVSGCYFRVCPEEPTESLFALMQEW
jgi:hypothetical protein